MNRFNFGPVFDLSLYLIEELITKYNSVFSNKQGSIDEFEARIKVKTDANPKFYKPRPVPYALKGAVEAELERLENEGIILKVRSPTVSGLHPL